MVCPKLFMHLYATASETTPHSKMSRNFVFATWFSENPRLIVRTDGALRYN